MSRIVRIHEYGDASVLKIEDVAVPAPAAAHPATTHGAQNNAVATRWRGRVDRLAAATRALSAIWTL